MFVFVLICLFVSLLFLFFYLLFFSSFTFDVKGVARSDTARRLLEGDVSMGIVGVGVTVTSCGRDLAYCGVALHCAGVSMGVGVGRGVAWRGAG